MSVQIDSRFVEIGDVFFAFSSISGRNILPFLEDAFEKGAKTLVVDKEIFYKIPRKLRFSCKFVCDTKDEFSVAVTNFFFFKPEILVAVTGTNGKSSVVSFVQQLWGLCGFKGISIGTMGVKGNGILFCNISNLTTLDPVILHVILSNLKIQKVKAVALEASSHGLEQKRLDGFNFSAAVFTNFTMDHLDYHKTRQKYFDAKTRLFSKLLLSNSIAIIFGDSAWTNNIMNLCKKKGVKIITYGFKQNNDWHLKIQFFNFGQKIFILRDKVVIGNFYVPFLGNFQALNILAAFLIAVKISNIPVKKALKACSNLEIVEGRLKCIATTFSGAKIFIDYAHTPNALENVLQALRLKTKNNLFLIFGCGGDRDFKKRFFMGKLANNFADYIILTDDNPRTENPKYITDQILQGIPNSFILHNRREAIKFGISKLKRGDVLLIAGKGHEREQLLLNTILSFNDSSVALEILKN